MNLRKLSFLKFSKFLCGSIETWKDAAEYHFHLMILANLRISYDKVENETKVKSLTDDRSN